MLMFAEVWPSLSFAAQAMGCLDITTWCKFKSGKSKVEFTSTRLGSSWTGDLFDSLAARYGNQHQVTVLIQGWGNFTKHVRVWSDENLTQAKTLEQTDEIGDWDNTFLWKGDLSHQALGGVTTGSWSYRCSEPLGDPKDGIDRNLGLLFKLTHGGRAISRVPGELLIKRDPLREHHLIKPCKTNPWVVAPSVFAPNKEKVLRRLQINKLLDVYNMEVATQKELSNYWCRSHCSPSCAFAQAAPLKKN